MRSSARSLDAYLATYQGSPSRGGVKRQPRIVRRCRAATNLAARFGRSLLARAMGSMVICCTQLTFRRPRACLYQPESEKVQAAMLGYGVSLRQSDSTSTYYLKQPRRFCLPRDCPRYRREDRPLSPFG